MRLLGMAKQLQRLLENQCNNTLQLDEAISVLVDAEYTHRSNNKLATRLRQANFKYKQAALEDVVYRADRGITKVTVNELRTSRWIQAHKTVVLAGATGAGKTWLACAIGQYACREGFTVLYKRTSRLLDELEGARAQGNYAAALKGLAKINVLILDDFCMMPLSAAERRNLLEVLEDRYGTAATIIASQLDPDQWHAAIGDATFADSICDRLVHGAHRLHLTGDSLRKVLAQQEAQPSPNATT